jgi:hypothetical protein
MTRGGDNSKKQSNRKMIIKVWNREDKIKSIGSRGHEPTYTIEISNEEIDHFIKPFGEGFGKAFAEAIVKVSEAED